MSKHVFILLLFVFSNIPLLAGDYKSTYVELLNKKEYSKLKSHLEEWENREPADPELFIAWFNYYINRNLQETITQTRTPESEKALTLTDPDTGEVVGYLSPKQIYDRDDVLKGLEYLDSGIQKYPRRLDMHFGRIHIQGEIEEFEAQKKSLIEVLRISKKINNSWLWHDGNEKDDARDFTLGNVQARTYEFMKLKKYDYVEEISNLMIQYYPEQVYGYNNLASIYLQKKDYRKALSYFHKAEKVAPDDVIVIANLAYMYRMMDDTENAIRYYEKLLGSNDTEMQELARKNLKELKK